MVDLGGTGSLPFELLLYIGRHIVPMTAISAQLNIQLYIETKYKERLTAWGRGSELKCVCVTSQFLGQRTLYLIAYPPSFTFSGVPYARNIFCNLITILESYMNRKLDLPLTLDIMKLCLCVESVTLLSVLRALKAPSFKGQRNTNHWKCFGFSLDKIYVFKYASNILKLLGTLTILLDIHY